MNLSAPDLMNYFMWQLVAILFYKYGTIYREVMATPRFDWCQLTNQTSPNLLNEQLMTLIRDSFPELIQKCSYTVTLLSWFLLIADSFLHDFLFLREINVFNRTLKTGGLISIFPTGDYRLNFYITDQLNNQVVDVFCGASFMTPDKETFGLMQIIQSAA